MSELIQVIVASFKKRHLKTVIPSTSSGLGDDIDMTLYHRNKGSTLSRPTDKFSFLNKACTFEDADQELNPDGTEKDPWRLCTVEQVEDLKARINTIPIGSTGVIAFVGMRQGSFQILQAKAMDRNIFGHFEIPAGSFSTFSLLCVAMWIPFYDQVFLPVVSKIRGKPTQFSSKQRMGAGILITLVSLIVTASVECIRRSQANNPAVGNKSWISDDINDAHFDYYFWGVSVVILLNFVYFLFCCRSYGPCNVKVINSHRRRPLKKETKTW